MRTPALALLCTLSLQLALVGGAPNHAVAASGRVHSKTDGLSRLVDRIANSDYGLMDPFETVQPSIPDLPIEVAPSHAGGVPSFYSDFQPTGEGVPVRGPTTTPDDLRPIIWKQAHLRHIDPLLVEAVLQNESGYDPKAVSKTGALGLMQLMPETARGVGVGDAFDPAQNIAGGTQYLAQQLERFQGDVELALAAYNAGPETVIRWGGVPPYPETVEYVQRVLQDYRSLQGLPPVGAPNQTSTTNLISPETQAP